MNSARVIIHVTESYGGGVASAIDSYVDSAVDFEHHLVASFRERDFQDSGELNRFSSVAQVSRSIFGFRRGLRAAIKRIRPDWLHVHSSFAGVYTRILPLTREVRIAYTPHCYAFERLDISPFARKTYRLIEKALSVRTDLVLGCSVREVQLAKTLNGSMSAVLLPNRATLSTNSATMKVGNSERPAREQRTVVALGRLAPQKDPAFFAEFVVQLRKSVDTRAVWIGGGDETERRRLEDAGIIVTGWLPRSVASQRLAEADLYVHTARWEGFPLAVLEANDLDVPIVSRGLPYLGDIASEVRGDSPKMLATSAERVLASEGEACRNRETWRRFLADNTAAEQRRVLEEAFG